MSIFKKLKLLKILFNGKHVFYRAGVKWYFETEITKTDEIKLLKEYCNYVKK